MQVIDLFVHMDKTYEIRSWHDDTTAEWIARAFCANRPVEGYVYIFSDETVQDLSLEKYRQIVIDAIKDDIKADRWAEWLRIRG